MNYNKKLLLFVALAFFAILASFVASCSGGEELLTIEGKDYDFRLFGNVNAITRICVIDRASGEILSEISTDYRSSEPWLGEDKENYGFELRDLNADGAEDFIIKTCRTVGEERYLFYLSKGDGEFRLEEKLSSFSSPKFGEGTVAVSAFSRIDEPAYADEPPVYELRSEEYVYGWTERGRLKLMTVFRLSYFSETDIYRYSTLVPDPDDQEGMMVDEEFWIDPDKLDEFGFEPLE